MELLFFLGGAILGILVSMMIHISKVSYGTITIDEEKEVCNIAMNTEELVNRKKEQVMLKVAHKKSQK